MGLDAGDEGRSCNPGDKGPCCPRSEADVTFTFFTTAADEEGPGSSSPAAALFLPDRLKSACLMKVRNRGFNKMLTLKVSFTSSDYILKEFQNILTALKMESH